MNKNIVNVKTEHELKEQIKKEILQRFEKKDVDIYIRRELNIWGRIALVGIYSVALFLGGIFFYKNYGESKLASGEHLEKVHQEIKEYFIKEKEVNALSYNLYGETLAQRVEDNISRTIASQKNHGNELMRDQNTKISALKRKNMELKQQLELLIDSGLMIKNNDIDDHKALPYTKVNFAVLRKKHSLKERELENKISMLEQVFIGTHDMSDPKVQKLHKKLKQAAELELYKLRQDNYQVRNNFKKNKYLAK